MENVLLFFSLKYNGDWDKIYNALDKKEKIPHSELESVKDKVSSKYITILSPLYPHFLKNTHKPPFVIFYEGDVSILTNYHKTIGVVGGQTPDKYGIDETIRIVKQLADENRVISTINEVGVNEYILDSSIEIKCRTLLILKTGMKDFLLKDNKLSNKIKNTDYLVLSETYDINSRTEESLEEYSNRLFCGLVKGVLFTQFKDNEPIKKVVSYALNDGKDIFAIPEKAAGFSGTNQLIKQGAKLVDSAKDILNEL